MVGGGPAQGRSLRSLEQNAVGVRVDSILDLPETKARIQPDDVILRAGPYEVGSDGTILYRRNRIQMALAFQEVQHGQSVPVALWRDGQVVDVDLPVFVHDLDRATRNQYDVPPRYYIYAGLVFTPLTLDYIKTIGHNWANQASADLIYELFYRRHEAPETLRDEPIVLAMILAHEVNANTNFKGRLLVDAINGIRIDKLEDVVRAFASTDSPEQVIEFLPEGTFECLDREEAEKAHPEILKAYQIVQDRRL